MRPPSGATPKRRAACPPLLFNLIYITMSHINSIEIKEGTILASKFTKLAYGTIEKKKYNLNNDIAQRPWFVTINFAAYGTPTTALCEAEGTPAKVQLVIDLYNDNSTSFVVGCFHLGYHIHMKCPKSLHETLNYITQELKGLAGLYENISTKIDRINSQTL